MSSYFTAVILAPIAGGLAAGTVLSWWVVGWPPSPWLIGLVLAFSIASGAASIVDRRRQWDNVRHLLRQLEGRTR